MKTVLIINAHQRYEGISEGRLNSAMAGAAKEFFEGKGWNVLETVVEKGYNAPEEVEKHMKADLIILQTPVFWFNAPWIYKKYADEVFGAGLYMKKMAADDGRTRKDPSKQYGTGGKMQGKKFMISSTWNAPKEAFNDKKQYLLEGKGIDDALLNIATNYKFCGCVILPGFACFDVVKNPKANEDIEAYKHRLSALV